MKISLVKRKSQFFLSLFVASVIGTQVAQASFEFHCPALLNEESRKSVTGNEEYSYSGDTTGDKRLLVETRGYGIKQTTHISLYKWEVQPRNFHFGIKLLNLMLVLM